MKKKPWYSILSAVLLVFCAGPLAGQEIMTAENFFDQVSRRYGEVRDYIARLTIVQEKETSAGTLYYKSPNLLRIDYSSPAEQVLVTDGAKLTIYLPQYRVVMIQPMRQRSAAALSDMASRQGLLILRRNYSIAYLERPGKVPLEPGSPEMVTKLKLTWRASSEGFRELILSINAQNMIRRIDAVSLGYQKIQFNFENIQVNQNIPDARFRYDPPPSANVQENFLYEPE